MPPQDKKQLLTLLYHHLPPFWFFQGIYFYKRFDNVCSICIGCGSFPQDFGAPSPTDVSAANRWETLSLVLAYAALTIFMFGLGPLTWLRSHPLTQVHSLLQLANHVVAADPENVLPFILAKSSTT